MDNVLNGHTFLPDISQKFLNLKNIRHTNHSSHQAAVTDIKKKMKKITKGIS